MRRCRFCAFYHPIVYGEYGWCAKRQDNTIVYGTERACDDWQHDGLLRLALALGCDEQVAERQGE